MQPAVKQHQAALLLLHENVMGGSLRGSVIAPWRPSR